MAKWISDVWHAERENNDATIDEMVVNGSQ